MAQHDDNAADPGTPETLIVLGKVGRVHGVQGWVRLNSWTEPRETLLEYSQCFLRRAGDWQPALIAEGRTQGKGLVARFAGIDDREQAATLTGADIGVPREQMPDPGDGHYYWVDLEGATVCHRDGRVLGRLERLLQTGANDVMVVAGEQERLIPFVMDKVVLRVDLAARRIDVDWEWD